LSFNNSEGTCLLQPPQWHPWLSPTVKLDDCVRQESNWN
jgi:hypothetical protein